MNWLSSSLLNEVAPTQSSMKRRFVKIRFWSIVVREKFIFDIPHKKVGVARSHFGSQCNTDKTDKTQKRPRQNQLRQIDYPSFFGDVRGVRTLTWIKCSPPSPQNQCWCFSEGEACLARKLRLKSTLRRGEGERGRRVSWRRWKCKWLWVSLNCLNSFVEDCKSHFGFHCNTVDLFVVVVAKWKTVECENQFSQTN